MVAFDEEKERDVAVWESEDILALELTSGANKTFGWVADICLSAGELPLELIIFVFSTPVNFDTIKFKKLLNYKKNLISDVFNGI